MRVGVELPEEEAKAEAVLHLEADVQEVVRQEATAARERQVRVAARL